MGNTFLNLEIESLDTTKKMMESKYSELLEMFNHYKTMIEETKEIYDTKSASLYREIGSLYVDMGIRYLNNDLKPYIDSLDNIKQIYIDSHNQFASSVGGTNHE